MPPATTLHFDRYEFKYVLPRELRDTVEKELQFFMQLDPYVAEKPHARYIVRSLYFDNRSYTHYYDKLDGQITRAKFRLRTYTDDPAEGCATFLEIKGRHNNRVFKHRAPLSRGEKGRFRGGESDISGEILARLDAREDVRQRFLYSLFRKRIEPVMLIDYLRRPYVTKYAPTFRVTFDEQLRGTPTETLHPALSDGGRSLLAGSTVMEIKFRFHLPSWFHRIIQSYELRRVSVSKICKGIEAYGLTPCLE